ncbi:E3 SUMO-protein ligase RanBP2-like [Hydractinia symbiolongicarpus]|uniref:E3 SUMO-protein ligase RanBP2-like n=1 Tax=Hydractinia symbiolongicarpus TaxID=13093 RepID=UPI002550D7B7|nr:E3 SUMO-protein ligase RanBP2-like [Hydractinia symbiolongicarpus]
MFKAPANRSFTPKRIITSHDVDKYVQKEEEKTQSPFQKKAKAFAFARLYFDAKDYVQAKRQLENYLSIQDRDFKVHNLMGEINEAMHNYPDALSSYKRSLELCNTQKDILIKVISLCSKCPIDPLRAKVWADKGARLCPGHPAVFELKWHLQNDVPAEEKDFEQMELLIADELTRRARDPLLHVNLVDMYVDADFQKRAFMHCQSVEKTGAFNDSLVWLECACNVFDEHRQRDSGEKLTACLLFALTLCKLINLHLRQSNTREIKSILNRFDKTVKEFREMEKHEVAFEYMTEWNDCVVEMRGQLYLNAAVYVMKLAQEEFLPWMKASRIMCALMFTSWNVKAPNMTQQLFSRHSPLKRQNPQAYEWSVLACARLSQAGHIILSMSSQFGEEWLKSSVTDFCTEQGRKTVLDAIFGGFTKESFISTDQDYMDVDVKIPNVGMLLQYDEVTVAEHAQDLHHIIWLGLHWDEFNQQIRPGVGVMVGRLFEGISLDVKNMKNCHFSSMCLRDVEAFIYAVIRSSKSIHLECSKIEDEMKLLPLQICSRLVTTSQQEWWQAAYGLYTGKVGTQSAAKLKVVLQKGLETLRCLRDHGIDPRILIYMAVAFWEKSQSLQNEKQKEYDYQDHWESLQTRAVYYIKEAIRILEIYKSNKTITVIEDPLILALSEPLLPNDIAAMLNKNYLKLADSEYSSGNLLEALKYYAEVNSLQSLYIQAQIYIRLASECDIKTIEGEKDYIYYHTKAKGKLLTCISNSDHSPEFKQTLLDQLQELQANNASAATTQPSSKKCLTFQSTVPSQDLNINDPSSSFADVNDVSVLVEKSILEDQLTAKELENQNLRQQLAMLRTQADVQFQQQVMHPQQIMHPQQFVPAHLLAPQQLPHGHQVIPNIPFGPNAPFGPYTPGQQTNGMETPTDLWWDSFSPQASFEKGYFAGLAEHVEQVREESGESEAPTLRDQTEATPTGKTSDITDTKGKTPTTPVVQDTDDIYVEPIVKLTAKSDLETGEEDESTKFVHRSKLYRFDKSAASWKERGVGDVKILINEKTNKARITMRRDVVFRVCCNHFITSDMMLEAKGSACWTWFTPADAVDGEVKPEQFAIKFKTEEIADQFKSSFIECQNLTNPLNTTTKTDKLKSASKDDIASTSSNDQKSSTPASNQNVQQYQNSDLKVVSAPPTTSTQTSMGAFRFKTPENAITESPEGKPIFSFATTQAQNSQEKVNPFLTPQAAPADSSTGYPSFDRFSSTTFKEKDPVKTSPSPFAGFSFKINTATATSTSTNQVTSTTSPSSSPFTGFSFSEKSTGNVIQKSNDTSAPLSQNFPFMSSLLKDTASTSSPPSSLSAPPTSKPGDSPVIIPGMNTLPVFEKGVVNSGIDPSSFWTSASPQKSFFTGNTSALGTIGHQEPREVDEEEFFKENLKASNEDEEYYGEDNDFYEDGDDYYGDNDEYYGDVNYEDYSYDPEEYFSDGEGYEPSKASSSRRGSSDDDQDERVASGNTNVEDRLTIKKKLANVVNEDVIDDEISITFEKKPSFTQKIKAVRFKLPRTFFLYESNKPCPGCRGCIESYDGKPLPSIEIEAQSLPETKAAAILGTTHSSFPAFGSKVLSSSPTSFAHLANSSSGFGGASGSFAGAGAQLFSSKSENNEQGDNEYDPQYDAIVQVSKLEDVKTGEEDDEILFKHRAKLYRFDGQWKERGVGDIKLTKNAKTGYCRVIMRRDLIYKLCANHAVMPNMDLVPLTTSDRSLVWFTPSDYSEGTPPLPQKFCVKFKNKQVTDEFKDQFDICKNLMAVKLEQDRVEQEKKENSATASNSSKVDQGEIEKESEFSNSAGEFFAKPPQFGCVPGTNGPLGDRFSAKPGQWECSTCLIRNEAAVTKCIACNSAQSIMPKTTLFAIPPTEKPDVISDLTPDQVEDSNDQQASPSKHKEEEPEIHVEAIVQVSKLDSITTGEEEEEIIFAHRAKLFRFDSSVKQWKERGIGDVKLAHNKNTNSCRVIMRREQIHKLCANHAIIPSMELSPLNNSDKAWTWFTQADISDGETKAEQFALRFKTAEIANNFKENFEKCKNLISNDLPKEVKEPKDSNFLSKFAPKEGSWSCPTCLIQNDGIAMKCPACQTANPDAVSVAQTSGIASAVKNSTGVFEFGKKLDNTPTAAGFNFGTKTDDTLGASPFTFSKKKEDTPTSVGFNFGTKTDDPSGASPFSFSKAKEDTPAAQSFNFDNRKEDTSTSSPFSFGNKAEDNTAAPSFCFGKKTEDSAVAPSFSFGDKTDDTSGTIPFSFGKKTKDTTAAPLFSFGNKKDDTLTSPFSFDNKSKETATTPSFSFGNKLNKTTTGSPFVSGKTLVNTNAAPSFSSDNKNEDTSSVSLFNFGKKSEENSADSMLDLTNEQKPANNLQVEVTPTNHASTEQEFICSEADNKQVEILNAGLSKSPEKSVTQIETNSNAYQASPSKLNEEEPEIHVEAIVQVSKLDSITTGEEDEETIFSHRAKLFRYDSSVKQWKERGLGDVKLTHNKNTNSCRVIMRREQIHKLCANHAIMPSMELSPLNNSDKAWTWFTQADISDGEVKPEQFALRFKTAEIANDFKENFEKCKNLISNDLPKEGKKSENSQNKPDFLSKFAPKEGSWSCPTCLVQNEEDVSHCPACQTAKPGNTPNQVKPFSFENANDTNTKFNFGTADQNSPFTFGEKLNTSSFKSNTSPFVFGQKQSDTADQINIQFENKETFQPSTFEADPNTWECPFCLARNAGQREFCRSCSKPKEKTPVVKLDPKEFSTPIMYNVDPLQTGKSQTPGLVQSDNSGFFLAKKEPSTSGFLFEKALDKELMPPPALPTSEKSTSDSAFTWKPKGLNIDNLFSFGSAPSPSLSAASSVDDVRVNTDVPSAFDGTSFNFQIPVNNQSAPKTPESKTKEGVLSALSPQTPTEEYDDEADTSGFVPLVTLSQVSHSTGEEGEEVLFEERSKMFLFNQQWKERGIGDLKILRDKTDNHHRLVMRRDQTHKICANHLLVPELTIKPMSGSTKAFVWKTAADISDGEPSEAMFAAKFKDEEKANRFAEVFTTACQAELFKTKLAQEEQKKIDPRKESEGIDYEKEVMLNRNQNEPEFLEQHENFEENHQDDVKKHVERSKLKEQPELEKQEKNTKIDFEEHNKDSNDTKAADLVEDLKNADLKEHQLKEKQVVDIKVAELEELDSEANFKDDEKEADFIKQFDKGDVENWLGEYDPAKHKNQGKLEGLSKEAGFEEQQNEGVFEKQFDSEEDRKEGDFAGDHKDVDFSVDQKGACSDIHQKEANFDGNWKEDVVKVDKKETSVDVDQKEADVDNDPKEANFNDDHKGGDFEVDKTEADFRFDQTEAVVDVGQKEADVDSDPKEANFNDDHKGGDFEVDKTEADFRFDQTEAVVDVGQKEAVVDSDPKEANFNDDHKGGDFEVDKTEANFRFDQTEAVADVGQKEADVDSDPKEANFNDDHKEDDLEVNKKEDDFRIDQTEAVVDVDQKEAEIDIDPKDVHLDIFQKEANFGVDQKEPVADHNQKAGDVDFYLKKDDFEIDQKEPEVNIHRRNSEEKLKENSTHENQNEIDQAEKQIFESQPDVIVISDSETEEVIASPSKDVQLVYEPSIENELKTKTKRLLLPSAFYHNPPPIGDRPKRTVGESSSYENTASQRSPIVDSAAPLTTNDEYIPDLILTHERITDSISRNKSAGMMLPSSFYNYTEKAHLTDECVEIDTGETLQDGCTESNAEVTTSYPTYKLCESEKEIFEMPCTLFQYSPKVAEFCEIVDGKVKILKGGDTSVCQFVVVNEEFEYVRVDIDEKLDLHLRHGSKVIYEWQAHLRRYAVKFYDILSTEKFKSACDAQNTLRVSQPVFGGAVSGVSFASLAAGGESGFNSNAGKTFSGSGKTLFASNGNTEEQEETCNDGNIHVEPIVQLTSVVVHSGEENEYSVFTQRCKLYRFDSQTKKWKERGVGEMKLLRHKESGKPRLIMRRDQVRKLCANHLLLPQMQLSPFPTNELTVTWNAIADMSEGIPEDCVLAARFKTTTLLSEFKTKFEALCNGEGLDDLLQDEAEPTHFGACDPLLGRLISEM